MLVALSPLLVLAAIDLLLLDDPRAGSPRATERVAGAGSSATSAAPVETAPAPSPPTTVAAVTTADAVDPASLPTAAPDPSAPPPSHEPTARPSGPTLERRAVDALIAGERARAAALYDGLAAQSPNNPAFARAALLLRRPTAPTSSP